MAGTPALAELEAKGTRRGQEEAGKKKTKKVVKLSQEEIDAYMKMAPPRPLTRFDPERILQLADPEDPEVLQIALKVREIAERCAARHDAFQDEKKSIREQFLATGEAFIEVTDDEAE